jgi:mannose-6-phosphate isomerase-like protein (cupin superfamily)
MSQDQLGRFPVEGSEARAKPVRFFHVSREQMLRTVFGEKHPIPLTFFVSNDLVHMGEFVVPPGGVGVRASEPDVHRGDEALYVQVGPICVFFPDTGEAFYVNEGETMYIPEGVRHQYMNYSSKLVKGIFAVAPEL